MSYFKSFVTGLIIISSCCLSAQGKYLHAGSSGGLFSLTNSFNSEFNTMNLTAGYSFLGYIDLGTAYKFNLDNSKSRNFTFSVLMHFLKETRNFPVAVSLFAKYSWLFNNRLYQSNNTNINYMTLGGAVYSSIRLFRNIDILPEIGLDAIIKDKNLLPINFNKYFVKLNFYINKKSLNPILIAPALKMGELKTLFNIEIGILFTGRIKR